MDVGRRRRPPGLVDGAGETALKGEGEREIPLKSTPRVRDKAEWAGRVPVGEAEEGTGEAMGGGRKEK